MVQYKVKDIIRRANTKEDRSNTAMIYYAAGEQIGPGDLLVKDKGIIAQADLGPMFYFGFKAGQLLLPSRSFESKKAAIATYDGICSEKTFVLESADKSLLLDEYLIFIFQNEDFWQFAEENKSGSVNFFLNWSTIAEYEFTLPSLAEQKVLAEKLWAAYEVKQSYLKMIAATEEMVKAQFVEMFGNQDTNDKKWNESIVKDEFSLTMGKTPARDNSNYWEYGTNKWISISDMAKYGRFTGATEEMITDQAVSDTGIKMVPRETIIMSFKLSIGRTAITSEDIYTNEAIMAFRDFDKTKFNIDFLQFLISNKNWLLNAKQAVKGQTLNKESIGNSRIIVPPITLQKKFAEIYNQADKSISELRKSVDAIDKVIKSLINENL